MTTKYRRCCNIKRYLTIFKRSNWGNKSGADKRSRLAALATLANAGARLTGFVTALISVPLTLAYLGTERYGLWVALSSAIALLSFADLGLGNGLLTSVAHRTGADDVEGAQADVSSAFFMLCTLGVAVLVVYLFVSPLVSWNSVFNIQDPLASNEVSLCMLVLIVTAAASMPLGVVQRTQVGLQLGYHSHLWSSAGSLLGLVLVLLAVRLEAGLPWLVAAMTGGPLAATTLNFIHFFARQRPDLRPSLRLVSLPIARQLLGLGWLFMVLQISVATGPAADSLILTHTLGTAAVAELSVPLRLFAIVGAITSIIVMPLWPAYGEAAARGDFTWIRLTLGKSLLLVCCISAALSCLLLLCARPLFHVWIGDSINPPISLLLWMSVWTTLGSVGSATSVFLNGMKVVLFQVYVAIAFGVVGLLSKLWLVSVVGVPGVVMGGVLSYAVTTLIPYLIHIPRILSQASIDISTVSDKDNRQ